ncbi:MAG: hypothetical protein LBK47_05085 [Prevotellaceae bacterium]|jgi:DNA/RNA endonuclease G (NUC1)|nr:hypothetical protein [Prevotellaceae bacterium]
MKFWFANILFYSTLIYSCANSKPTATLDLQASMLLNDLKAEGYTQSGYAPSESLTEKYNLYNDNQTYYVSGFLYVTGEVTERSIKKLGVQVGTKANNFWTVQVPITQLEKLTTQRGVVNFEAGKKTELKKKSDRGQLQ